MIVSRVVPAGALVALAGLGWVASAVPPSRGGAGAPAGADVPGGRAAVVGAHLGCPDIGRPATVTVRAAGARHGAAPRVLLGPAGHTRSLALAGHASLSAPLAVPAGRRPSAAGPGAGAPAVLSVSGAGAGAAAAAVLAGTERTARRPAGSPASGSAASAAQSAASSVLVEASCEAPRRQVWFAGPGTDTGGDPVLLLGNPGGEPAHARVSVLTPFGPAAAGGAGGRLVTVAPGETLRLRLAALAPDAAASAVGVTTLDGRIVAALLDRRSDARGPRGADTVPPVSGPSRLVTITGWTNGPAAPGTTPGTAPGTALQTALHTVPRTAAVLVLAAPGADTLARVEIIGRSGRYVPSGLAEVPVDAGTARRLELPALDGSGPAGRAAALRVTAVDGGPLLAGVRVTLRDGGGPPARPASTDVAWLGAGEALTGPVPLPPVPSGGMGEIVLTAPGAAAGARLAGRRVEVAAGRSVAVAVRPGEATVLVPSGGPLFATRVLYAAGRRAAAPALSALAVPARPAEVEVPAVSSDPRAPRE